MFLEYLQSDSRCIFYLLTLVWESLQLLEVKGKCSFICQLCYVGFQVLRMRWCRFYLLALGLSRSSPSVNGKCRFYMLALHSVGLQLLKFIIQCFLFIFGSIQMQLCLETFDLIKFSTSLCQLNMQILSASSIL